MAQVVLLDVNETLTDMSGLDGRFATVLAGLPEAAPAHVVRALWFAGVLRDGFAAASAGWQVPFADLARVQAEQLLGSLGVPDPEGAAGEVLAGVPELDVYPEVPAALAQLTATGYDLVPLTNGAVAASAGAFDRAGVSELFKARLSVVDAGIWKPAAASYEWAAQQLGAEVQDCVLVAIHPWDLMGAGRTGMRTAWCRRGWSWPAYFAEPDVTGDDLLGVAAALG